MAARRKRATVQRAVAPRASRAKRAGLYAHNARVMSAITARQTPGFGSLSKRRSMGLAEARMNRLRRKAGKPGKRAADRRAVSRQSLSHYGSQASARRLTANPAMLKRRPARMYKRDSRGRFARK